MTRGSDSIHDSIHSTRALGGGWAKFVACGRHVVDTSSALRAWLMADADALTASRC